MKQFAWRLGQRLLLLVGVSLCTFVLLSAAPGNFFDDLKLNPQISAATVSALQVAIWRQSALARTLRPLGRIDFPRRLGILAFVSLPGRRLGLAARAKHAPAYDIRRPARLDARAPVGHRRSAPQGRLDRSNRRSNSGVVARHAGCPLRLAVALARRAHRLVSNRRHEFFRRRSTFFRRKNVGSRATPLSSRSRARPHNSADSRAPRSLRHDRRPRRAISHRR